MITFGPVELDDDTFYTKYNLELKIGNRNSARGCFSMNPNEITWKAENSENGIRIPWKCITVQAITQDLPRKVYFMIDVNIDFPNVFEANEPVPLVPVAIAPVNLNGVAENIADPPENGIYANRDEDSDEGNETDDSVPEITEFWLFSPNDPGVVDDIYGLMIQYPIERENNSDDEMNDSEEDEFFDGNDAGDDVRDEMANMEINDDQFADAQE